MREPQKQGGSPGLRGRWELPLANGAGEIIPGYGLVVGAATSSNITGPIRYTATKPSSGVSDRILINGPAPIAADKDGFGTNRFPAIALYETADGTPTAGQEWGPLSGSFKLRSSGTGFRIIGGVDGSQGAVQVMRLGSSSEKNRLIRGQSVGAQSGATILLDHVVVLSGGLDPSGGNPATQVRVANIFSQSLEDNELAQAVYSPAVTTHETVNVDWELLKTTGESTPPLRHFEIASGKFSTTDSVLVDWLDDDGNITESSDVIYDPELLFAGQPDGYVAGQRGFHGVALRRRDLATEAPEEDRWEIVQMEGFARWITATFEPADDGGDERKNVDWFRFTGVYTSRDQWNRKPPAAVGDPIRWFDDIENKLVEPIVGDTVLMELVDSNGLETPADGWSWHPQYVPVAVFDRTAIVQVQAISMGDPAGHPVSKTGDVFPGLRANVVGVNPADGDFTTACWITSLSDVTTLPNKSKHIGRFTGLYDPDPEGSSDERPRFAIGGGEKYQAIRGLTKGSVAANSSTFLIDNVIPLANGLDPVSGNSSTEVTVQNIQKEAIPDNTPITAIYDGANWELLAVERFRAIRGKATSSIAATDGTLSVDNISVLDSGIDPRSDPTSSSETVTVYNVPGNEYVDNAHVEADWNTAENRWEARQTHRSISNNRWAKVYEAIGAATSNEVAGWGGGSVLGTHPATGVLSDTPTEVVNLWPMGFEVGAMVLIDTSFSPPRVVNGTCEPFDGWVEE